MPCFTYLTGDYVFLWLIILVTEEMIKGEERRRGTDVELFCCNNMRNLLKLKSFFVCFCLIFHLFLCQEWIHLKDWNEVHTFTNGKLYNKAWTTFGAKARKNSSAKGTTVHSLQHASKIPNSSDTKNIY